MRTLRCSGCERSAATPPPGPTPDRLCTTSNPIPGASCRSSHGHARRVAPRAPPCGRAEAVGRHCTAITVQVVHPARPVLTAPQISRAATSRRTGLRAQGRAGATEPEYENLDLSTLYPGSDLAMRGKTVIES